MSESLLGAHFMSWEHGGIVPLRETELVRIRGQIGPWPVDLSIELEAAEWAQLAGVVHMPEGAASVPTQATRSAPVVQSDDALVAAKRLLQAEGPLNGPQLLERLATLGGSTAGGKRLLFRLRHAAGVKVDSVADAPLYRWVGPEGAL